jgi:fluoroquinolone transport system permease protein
MTRLTATTRLDMGVQARSKLYHISIGLALVVGLALRFLVPEQYIPGLMPIFYLSTIGGTTYMFVAGMVLFEKSERTLAAQIVSPLRIDEYLLAKVGSLLLVVLMEGTIVLLLGAGFTGYNPLLVYAGVILMAIGNTLGGFIQASRYDSITDFLVPATAVLLVTQLPLVFLSGISDSWLWYLIPTTAPALLIQAAFVPEMVSTGQIIYGFAYSLVWIVGLFLWARRAFTTNIVLKGA